MSRSAEGQLVALARGLFSGRGQEVQLLLHESWPAPAKLSPPGLRVLEDTLAKGAALWLTRHGAWRDRLWSKRAPPPLHFESSTVQLLSWMFEQPLGHEATAPLRLNHVTSLGCELLLLAALEAVVDTPAERQLTSQAAVRQSLLCRLAFPVTLALGGTSELHPAFEPTAEQDFAIEALQPSLARWWRDAERLKARLLMPADLLRAGLAQARMLDGLLTWAQRTDRRERCTFLLEAMAPLVQPKATAADFVAAFDERISLRERHAARKAAAAALHGVARLRQWDEEARTVRFIDDGYDAAQARVRAYEAVFGAQRFVTAQRLCDELDALPS